MRLLDAAERRIVRLTVVHRSVCLVGLLLLSLRFDALLFDTSPRLTVELDEWRQERYDVYAAQSATLKAHTALLRWDTAHFLGMAATRTLPVRTYDERESSCLRTGLHAEQSLAFQPGIVWLLRATGAAHKVPPLSSSCGPACRRRAQSKAWSAKRAILLTSLLATTASIVLPLLLYRLTLVIANRNRQIAQLTALVSVFSTAPSTLISPTPEAFFAVFALLACMCCARFAQEQRGVRSDKGSQPHALDDVCRTLLVPLLASLLIALSVAFRVNGVYLVGFILWHLWWQARRPQSTLAIIGRLIWTLALTLVALSPFIFSQVWAYDRFCHRQAVSDRPWCGKSVPLAYTFVQSAYWNVGFFRYWSVSQLPNWALASPVLLLAARWSISFYRTNFHTVVRLTFLPFSARRNSQHAQDEKPTPRSEVHKSTRAANAFARSTPFHVEQTPFMLPHAHFTLIVSATLILTSHVQIALRFATPGALPAVWWSVAGLLVTHSSWSKRSTPSLGVIVTLLVLWNVTSVLLYAGFYPPA